MKSKTFLLLLILIISMSLAFAACEPDDVDDVHEFTVTVVGGSGGGVFEENSACTVTATVEDNREFVEWQVNGVTVSADAVYTFTVTQDVTLTAVTKDKAAPPEPTFDLGAFARKWIGKTNGGTLDLSNLTWTLASDVKITSVSGSGANTVIDCVANAVPYKITLTTDGELKVTDAEYDQISYTFMPSAEPFNGVWALSDDYVSVDEYVLLISEPNQNGLFGWVPMYKDGAIDEDFLVTAITRLVFHNDGNASLQFVNAFGIIYELNADNNIVVEDEDLLYAPTNKFFADCYASKSGTVYNLSGGLVSFDGNSCRVSLQHGKYGAGLYFMYERSYYAFIQTLDGVGLYSDNGYEIVSPVVSPLAFVGSYSNGATTLTVSGNMAITIDETEYTDGTFVTLSDLDRVETIAPSGLAGLQQTAISFDNASKYLIWIPNGVAIITGADGNYVIQSAYFTESAMQPLQDKFLSGLSSATDKYTTGGRQRITVGFNFENGNVIINDVAIPFNWHYAIRTTGDEYATIVFDATIFSVKYSCALYPYFDYNYVRLEMMTADNASITVKHDMASQSLYMQMLGTSYYKQCDGYVEAVQFAQNGRLTLTRGAQGSVENYDEYELTLDHVFGVLVATFADNQAGAKFEVPIYCDNVGVYITVVGDVYVNPVILNAIGVYCDGEGLECLELLPNTHYKFNANGITDATAQIFEDFLFDNGNLIGVFADGVIEFADDKATVTTADGKTFVYVKKGITPPEQGDADELPEQFIGVYCDSDGVAFIEVLSGNMFLYDELGDELNDDVATTAFDTVTIDGDTVTCTKTYNGLITSWTVIFEFNGDTVTVIYEDEDPVVYTKQNQ